MFYKSSCFIVYLLLLMTILTAPFSCAEFKDIDGDENQKRQKVEFSSLSTESALREETEGGHLKDVARTFKYLHKVCNYQLFSDWSDFDRAKKLQKLCYFANAVHVSLHGYPISYTKFEAHRHGAYAEPIQEVYEEKIPDALPALPLDAISSAKFVALALQPYKGKDLSDLMHLEGLPWQKIRKPYGLRSSYEVWGRQMPLDSYNAYTNHVSVQATIVKGFISSVIEQDEEMIDTAVSFFSKYPKVLEGGCVVLQDEIKKLLGKLLKDSNYEEFFDYLKSKNPIPRRLLKFMPNLLIHRCQSIAQAAAAEVVFPYSFIEKDEIYLMQDPQFQIRLALGTACNCIPASHYMIRTLKIIFDLEDPKQSARVKGLRKLVKNKFQKLISFLVEEPLEEEPYWQDVYVKALAFFYREEYEEASTLLKRFLESFPDAPPSYRKDAYRRQVFITSDMNTVEAAKKEFPEEFLLTLALNQKN